MHVYSDSVFYGCDMKLKKTVTCCVRGNAFSIEYSTKVVRQVMRANYSYVW